jgi:hypothetical protein
MIEKENCENFTLSFFQTNFIEKINLSPIFVDDKVKQEFFSLLFIIPFIEVI